MITAFANHVWQSTLFAVAAALISLALRRNRAAVRHGLWLAASLKFLLPWALLAGIGGQFGWVKVAKKVAPAVSLMIEEVGQPFVAPSMVNAPTGVPWLPSILVTVWLAGIVIVAGQWWMRWRRMASMVRAATPVTSDQRIKLVTSTTSLEPGVFGIRRPVLVLPEGIAERLGEAQLHAVIAHELCHVRRRDNLVSAVHMAVEALFWFHPLVWWLGSRLVEERERACDEEVVRLGVSPAVYAESILNACQFYLESPLACVAGVTGASLEKRVERIMTAGIARRLDCGRKLLLAVAGVAAVAGPALVGALDAPRARAQSGKLPQFEVASVKPTEPGSHPFKLGPDHGGLTGSNMGVKQYIGYAFHVQLYQLSGDLGGIGSEPYDIVGKAPADTKDDERRLMLQSLLAERFALAVHRETKQMPIFALVVAKNGPKLREAPEGRPENGTFRAGRGRIVATGATMEDLALMLTGAAGRPVVDRTNLKGKYDFTLEYLPDSPREAGNPNEPGADPNGLSIFGALEQQLRLRLEAARGPVEIVVVDHVEKPSAN